MREIGSEFWLDEVLPQASSDRDGVYTISGRTAIDVIIKDILATRQIHNVYMPAWGCDSMLAPFVDRDIKVDLYDMSFNGQLEYAADENHHADIFYVNNYFSYETTIGPEIVSKFKQKGAIVIYDSTHSMLMDDKQYKALADYSFASIRKWMGVIGGAVVNGVKDFQLKPCPYLDCKEQAMRMKKAFIDGDTSIDKQVFLTLYGEFGHHLAEDYQNYEMDDLSYALYKTEDFTFMRRNRKENAKYLHEHLKGVRFLAELTENAVPLFVPVFFDTTEQRNTVRKKLIEAQIYCPIHWPKPTLIPADFAVNKIYDTELSLICDQRYDLDDMKRMVEVIKK